MWKWLLGSGRKQPATRAIQPQQVFTPRSGDVTDMYVDRPALERTLTRLFSSDEVIYLHGVSGSGKSWLFKKVFSEQDVFWKTIGVHKYLSGDFDKAYEELLHELGHTEAIESSDARSAGANIGAQGIGLSGESASESRYRHFEGNRLAQLARAMRQAAGERHCCIVFENVERAVANTKSLEKIIEVVMSVDDGALPDNRVKVLFVGIVPDLIDRLSTIDSANPLLTRISSLEVQPLSEAEAKQLIERGFFEKLGLQSDLKVDDLVKEILERTDGIPFHVHYYCRELAELSFAAGRITQDHIKEADKVWKEGVIRNQYDRVIGFTNAMDTAKKVRTKVLYVIARMDLKKFRSVDVKAEIDRGFSKDNISAAAVTASLNELAGETVKATLPKDPLLEIIERPTGGREYRFKGPLERAAARFALELREGRVIRMR